MPGDAAQLPVLLRPSTARHTCAVVVVVGPFTPLQVSPHQMITDFLLVTVVAAVVSAVHLSPANSSTVRYDTL